MNKKQTIAPLLLVVFLFSCSPYKKTTISKEAKSYIRVCADSINTAHKTHIVPAFLLNPCIDYDRRYWSSPHQPLLLRQQVISRVTEVAAIEYILNANMKELKVVCPYLTEDTIGLTYFKIPNIDKSFEQLLRARYVELKK